MVYDRKRVGQWNGLLRNGTEIDGRISFVEQDLAKCIINANFRPAIGSDFEMLAAQLSNVVAKNDRPRTEIGCRWQVR